MAARAFDVGGAAEYREHLDGHPAVPLWQQPWWLTATAGDRWDAITLHSGGRVVAALPYVELKRMGMRSWTQPPLTQSLGPWVEESTAKYVTRLSREHEALGAIADLIPANVFYFQNWGINRTNWLPFHWRGYSQSTRYTYRLDLSHGEEPLWKGLTDDARKAIRKARDRYAVTIESSTDLETFIRLNSEVFQRQQLDAPHSPELIRRVHAAASERGAVRVVTARESDGTPSATAFVVREADTAYYLMGGAHPVLRRSGAQTLVLWEAVVGELGLSRIFDFEGSMIQPIERVFRSFGAQQAPYLRVEGSKSRLIKSGAAARTLVKHLSGSGLGPRSADSRRPTG